MRVGYANYDESRRSAKLSMYFKYPFLVNIERYLETYFGTNDITLLITRKKHIVEAATERLEKIIETGRAISDSEDELEELLVFYTALAIAREIGDKWLISRLALAEAERALQFLINEKPENIERIAHTLGIDSFKHHKLDALKDPIGVKGVTLIYAIYDYSISFQDYVNLAKRLVGDSAWRTTNMPVTRGRVYLKREKAVRLLKEAIERFIASIISSFDINIENNVIINEAVERIRKKLGEKRIIRRGSTPLRTGVVEEAFPPCMANILERAKKGEHLSHHERFAIATFMLSIGAEIEEVVDVFRNMPDFNERITRYQVEHLAGQRGSMKKYRTYNCDTMRTLGLCIAECNTRSPLQAYYRNLKALTRRATRSSTQSQ